MRVGILALQSDFIEHAHMLRRMGHESVEVRLSQHLKGLDTLIMPGGESTTFGHLAKRHGLIEPLRTFAYSGKPICGTCAGLIFLARDVGRDQATLGLMDIKVVRNAFGRQVDSFIVPLNIKGLSGGLFVGVFIRAPVIESVASHVEVLCTLADGTIVAARQDNVLATSFHPELTDDPRLHAFFLHLRSPLADHAVF